MSLSDCPNCWNTPCTCGYEYRNSTKEDRIALASVILGIPIQTLKDALEDTIPKVHPMKEG